MPKWVKWWVLAPAAWVVLIMLATLIAMLTGILAVMVLDGFLEDL